MTTVKICGITNLEDAQVAVDAGADLLGFIFFPKSARYIAPQRAGAIVEAIQNSARSTSAEGSSGEQAEAVRSGPVRFVGVFVNETLATIEAILQAAKLDFAQLHGDEPLATMQALGARAYKALRPVDLSDATAAAARWYNPHATGPALFIDAYDPHAYGGTGKKADWNVAAALARQYPRFMLAGGLTAANVAAAVEKVQPWAVDVASGVEAEPGRKDPTQVRAFIHAAHGGR